MDVAGQTFTLDAEGNRTQLVESTVIGDTATSDTFTYDFDGLSRLLSADAVLFGGGTTSETFSYDAATNIQARTGPAATYAMDGANRVTSDGTQGFTWDDADRLVQRGADTFAYDALSRLTSATVTSTTTSYSYDGDGFWPAALALPGPPASSGTPRSRRRRFWRPERTESCTVWVRSTSRVPTAPLSNWSATLLGACARKSMTSAW